MRQPAMDGHHFRLGHVAYRRSRILGLLMIGALLICAIAALLAGVWLWNTYEHSFTFYVKWQDALVVLLDFTAFIALGGSVLVIRFLYALHAGYRRGMITLREDSLIVRDLSSLNLASIFWLMNSAFWCFIVVLVGLLPAMLLGWTMHLESIVLAVLLTGVMIVLSIAGLVVSGVAVTFVIIGCVGIVSFTRKLGGAQTYALGSQTVLRIDDFVLTIIYPGAQETMVDLSLLAEDDQHRLLSLLRERWVDGQRAWNPALGEEIELALQEAVLRSTVPV